MDWNITGEVTIGNINSMMETVYPVAQGKQIESMKDLMCGRSQYSVLLLLLNFQYFLFRSEKSRVKFNDYAGFWTECMERCPKYNRAMVTSFHDQADNHNTSIVLILILTSTNFCI